MFKKNYFLELFMVFLIIFGLGSWINFNITNNRKAVISYIHQVYSDDDCVKIIYQSKYITDEQSKKEKCIIDETISKYDDKKIVLSMSKEELINMFGKEDYSFEKIEGNKIFFTRNYKKYKYEPNKYVIGISDNRIAIFKTNEKGELFIEDPKKDITDIFVDKLPEDDIIYLKFGGEEYQYDSRDEAEEGIKAMFKS